MEKFKKFWASLMELSLDFMVLGLNDQEAMIASVSSTYLEQSWQIGISLIKVLTKTYLERFCCTLIYFLIYGMHSILE